MGLSSHESQQELFDVKGEAAPRPRAEYPGRLFFQVRHDQLVLSAVAAVIGLTVIFAFGVERGKELVRSERMLLARQPAADASDAPAVRASAPKPVAKPATPAVTAPKPASGAKPAVSPKPAATPAAAPKPKIKVATGTPVAKSGAKGGRYAVQVASFAQAKAARRELDRLQAKGKRAFMVIRDGRTVVFVGPLPSKTNASEELSELKSQYSDCFVKAL